MAMLLGVKRLAYPSNIEIAERAQHHLSVEDLPEPLVAEIVKRITLTSDLNSLSLVSKRLYTIDADQRSTIRVGYGLSTEALASLSTRFPNLRKVEIDYVDCTPDDANQLNNKGFCEFSSRSPSLTDLTPTSSSQINDIDIASLSKCKKLTTLRLNSTQNITSTGLLSVAIGCTSLSTVHLIGCNLIGSADWLKHLGQCQSLKELVVKDCRGISQYDLLKLGPGWRKLQKFEFVNVSSLGNLSDSKCYASSYDAHNPSRFDFCCESMKDLSLARFVTGPELGLRNLLGKCKVLEKLCIRHVYGLNNRDMIAISQSCSNLRSISLWLMPKFYVNKYTIFFTDDSLKALALSCPMLQTVKLMLAACELMNPWEIGFTRDGLLALIKSCPIRVLVLSGATFFDDKGMEALSVAPFLETLEVSDCKEVTDAGMRFIAHTPCLRNLTLRYCHRVTDDGFTDLVHAQKLESLTIEWCYMVSEEDVQGAARSVHYTGWALWPCGKSIDEIVLQKSSVWN